MAIRDLPPAFQSFVIGSLQQRTCIIAGMHLEARGFEYNLKFAPRANTVTIINWTECAIALVLIALRLYGSAIRVLRIQWDLFFVIWGAVSNAFGARWR